MLTLEKRNLSMLKREESFRKTFKALTQNIQLSYIDKSYILGCALILLEEYKLDKRLTTYVDLSYFIILKYSVTYNDYRPLYDFAINFGFYPVVNEIINLKLIDSSDFNQVFDKFRLENYKNSSGEYVETIEQFSEIRSFLADSSKEKSYIAPTSFGKSSVIVDYLNQNIRDRKKVVIVVPTKSLLSQTFQMIRKANLKKKIIIHDEMYSGEESFIAIFTQERSLRFLNRFNIAFDNLIIDEAHNILKKDSRSILLTRLLSRNLKMNPDQEVVYLSPLINEVSNLRLNSSQIISLHKVKFNVKEPELFELKLDCSSYSYDRFMNDYVKTGIYNSWFNYFEKNLKSKNFIYNYRPIKIEVLAKELSDKLPKINKDEAINDLIATLKREVHEKFYVVDTLKSGLVYIHGKIPDVIKEYIENKFKELPQIKFIVANSVILEGMNLPIDNLFIFNTRSLNGKELSNLIGRVNRLNYVFNNENNQLWKLLPQIHFINTKNNNGSASNMSNKISLLRSRVFSDKIENPTLNSFDITALGYSGTKLETEQKKIEMTLINEKMLNQEMGNPVDQLRQYLIETGINIFYKDLDKAVHSIIDKTIYIQSNFDSSWSNLSMLQKINDLFIDGLIENITDYELSRLQNVSAQKYYENHILISQKKSLNENIISLVKNFRTKIDKGDSLLYIGHSYGELGYDSNSYSAQNNVYVDLSIKNESELVNLAIVKLKMEDDFISFKLNKFIVGLFDSKLIGKDEYHKYVYGTTDEKRIALAKYGLNMSLVKRLQENNQIGNLKFDDFNNLSGNTKFYEYMSTLNDFQQFEIKRLIS